MTRTLMRYFGSHWRTRTDVRIRTDALERTDTHSCEAVEDVDVVLRVQVVNGAFTVDLESVYERSQYSSLVSVCSGTHARSFEC